MEGSPRRHPDPQRHLPFADRVEAGQKLAGEVRRLGTLDDPLVLALPRGGVPVGAEIARALDAPLDVLVVRKLGVPSQPELAMGAITSGPIQVLNPEVVTALGLGPRTIEDVARRETRELERRERAYRGERPPPRVEGRSVILVDDGVATGATMLAALEALRQRGPREVIVAVPVAPPETCERLRRSADRVVCLATPEPFVAIGRWYGEFAQLDDGDVREALAGTRAP
jgi:predicted phosphoribosyltransferase